MEVASSTNGQLTPPVMGAAAFLISEFTGVSYPEIIKHALIPAVASYIALVYIVHLEAMKLDLKGLPRPPATMTLAHKAIGFLSGFIGISLLGLAVYFGLGWMKIVMPGFAFAAVAILCAGIYLGLLWLASRTPDLVVDAPDAPITELPRPGPTALSGLFYLLPIVILIWCIMLERLSPALSAFWAAVAMVVVSLTQHPLKAWMRGSGDGAAGVDVSGAFRRGAREWFEGMVSGARNMIGIGVATGAAGVIVGTISLTGAHQVVGEFVEFLSGGHLMLMLVLVAIMSLILGMGLPTTANYIVVSSLMAPVIVALGAKSGLIVPLVAVHLFVFYFGILADDTPPVGLAAFAAAAISGGDPIRTGVQGFMYDIRTAILPFLFLFNTELLLIDVTVWKGVFVFLIAVAAMMLFASATQGYFFARSRIWESLLLLLVAFTLFRPGYWLDRISEPFDLRPGIEVLDAAAAGPPGAELRVTVAGPDFNDPDLRTSTDVTVPLGDAGAGASMGGSAPPANAAGGTLRGSRRIRWRRCRPPGEDRVAAADRRREGQAGGAAARVALREPGPDLRFLRRRSRGDRIDRAAARPDAERGLLPAGGPRRRPGDPDATAAGDDAAGASSRLRAASPGSRCRATGRRKRGLPPAGGPRRRPGDLHAAAAGDNARGCPLTSRTASPEWSPGNVRVLLAAGRCSGVEGPPGERSDGTPSFPGDAPLLDGRLLRSRDLPEHERTPPFCASGMTRALHPGSALEPNAAFRGKQMHVAEAGRQVDALAGSECVPFVEQGLDFIAVRGASDHQGVRAGGLDHRHFNGDAGPLRAERQMLGPDAADDPASVLGTARFR